MKEHHLEKRKRKGAKMRIKAKIQRPRSFVEFYAVCFGVGNVFFRWFVVVSSALFCLSVV